MTTPKSQIAFLLSTAQHAALKELSQRTLTPVTVLLRQAIAAFLKQQENKK
jgi:predicted transcriptional regulator